MFPLGSYITSIVFAIIMIVIILVVVIILVIVIIIFVINFYYYFYFYFFAALASTMTPLMNNAVELASPPRVEVLQRKMGLYNCMLGYEILEPLTVS